MPKIIDDAADQLTLFLNSESTGKNDLWSIGLRLVGLYMLFSLLKGHFFVLHKTNHHSHVKAHRIRF